jgi:hypothetical protein
MRFYSLSYEAVMLLPIRVFWMLNSMVDRIRADEALAIMPVHAATMGGEHVEGIVESYKRALGEPLVAQQKTITKEGKDKLKALLS